MQTLSSQRSNDKQQQPTKPTGPGSSGDDAPGSRPLRGNLVASNGDPVQDMFKSWKNFYKKDYTLDGQKKVGLKNMNKRHSYPYFSDEEPGHLTPALTCYP